MTKYTEFPGIRSLHDFIFARNSVTGGVTAKVRKQCYTGPFSNASIHIARGRSATDNVIPGLSESYCTLNKTRVLSESKITHLKQMYRDVVPIERRLGFLDI